MIIKKRSEIFENKKNIKEQSQEEVKVEEEKVELFDLDNMRKGGNIGFI